MRFSSNFVCKFQEVKSHFASCETLDIVWFQNKVFFLSKKNNVYLLWGFDAENENIPEVQTGVSIYAELFLKLPSNKKGVDVIEIDVIEDIVTISVNQYRISTTNRIFDPQVIKMILANLNQPKTLPVNELRWLLGISRFYKDSQIDIIDDLAFCNTPDGLYIKKLSEKCNLSCSFNATVLARLLSDELEYVNIGTIIISQFKKGGILASQLYKAHNQFVGDYKFIMKQKAKIRITLNLFEYKEILKILKDGIPHIDLQNNTLCIKTKNDEFMELHLDNNCKVDIAESKDFNRLVALTDIAYKLSLNSRRILRLISNEKFGVTIFINYILNVIKFSSTSYLLMSRQEEL